ncbi:MAG: hypothetical protein CMG00_04285 [Candidatus Marinimicrobia bacterium]|nr:hypothetical protein [Candidatus Neomarinimicrobiota bacterium]
MNSHLSFRSGNPALNANVFKVKSSTSNDVMTLNGAVNKTSLSLLILFCFGVIGYVANNYSFIFVGFIIGMCLALATIFKKHWSPYTVPLYAVFEGLALGSISKVYSESYDGIVTQAIFITFGIFSTLLFLYKSRIIKPTENFKLGIVAATGGIFFVYLISFIMSFFGSGISLIHSNGTFGIIFSLGVVVVASLNLVLDFDFIEEASEKNVPKYMEWYSAFGLLVTLIWLYLEILRLLAKLQSRR